MRFAPGLYPGVLVEHVQTSREASCAVARLRHPPMDTWVPLPMPQRFNPLRMPSDGAATSAVQ